MTARKEAAAPARRIREVKLSLSEVGSDSTIEVDGQDVSGLCRAVTVSSKVGEVTAVQLELARIVVSTQASARVEVDASTRDFLLSLGWTPPAGE